ncbi:MAG: DNA methyltransferase [Lachnospiraceae bacterium]|nr:DNA methyltransferase [Lachnospiraceae bacterium]
MTDAEQREAAHQFVNKWKARAGKEDEEGRSYWLDLLEKVFGVSDATDRIDFEKKVVVDGQTKRIDAYIPETHVLIEQKSKGKALDEKIKNSGDIELTPYEQAKRYNDNLPYDEKARWILTCNFSEIWIYDMNAKVPEPVKIQLPELMTKYALLDFLVKKEVKALSHEMEVSIKAGDIVGLLYDTLLKQYKNPEDEHSLKSLNVLCVRLVFCLYAEDAGIFGQKGMFHDYLSSYDAAHTRQALVDLFRVLDQKDDERDPYLLPELAAFPYVNGGLFADETVEIPMFTDEICTLLLTKASEDFDWSDISPTIFGAVFESTLNPETRRSGGMHYTSIENIHKVIDPLFLDDLKKELDTIEAMPVVKTRENNMRAFQEKLASLTFLDPACGSGNFLTETYLSIRRLENRVLRDLSDMRKNQLQGQISLFGADSGLAIKVSISQFYGIEINDFAVTVAKTALWIAESQMLKETEDIFAMHLDFLPLKTNAFIHEGNALRIDWNDVLPAEKCSYIMGNPPFHGFTFMTASQKEDMQKLFPGIKNLDYVCGWYKMASNYIQDTKIEVAFVSTNSIVQGETVARFWQFMKDDVINFAYRTFVWDSEATSKAHVHCIIIGFSKYERQCRQIFDAENVEIVKNINRYLIDGDNVFVESRNKPLCNVPKMIYGNKPADGGNLIIEDCELKTFLHKDPKAEKFIRPLLGSTEFINSKKRWCLWLVGVSPDEIRKCPEVMNRVQKCKEARQSSVAAGIRKFAATPTLFAQRTQPIDNDFVIVPRVSSQRRRYVPMGFVKAGTIVTDLVQIIPDAQLYHFGVLESNVHMSWMRLVTGRLKSDYRYLKDIVYNNFPWPTPTDTQRQKIEATAQGILDARALYPDASLADLYDPLTMPVELQKAHTANDKAVMEAYGFPTKMSEADCVAALMKMYQELTEKS